MKNMQQVNGKEMNGEKADLRAVFGIREKNPFHTTDEDVLTERLENMSMIDLQRMAIESGTSARGSAPALRKKIIREFKSYLARCELQKNPELGKVGDSFTKEQRERVNNINVSN